MRQKHEIAMTAIASRTITMYQTTKTLWWVSSFLSKAGVMPAKMPVPTKYMAIVIPRGRYSFEYEALHV
jgi:hypothetical protein